MTSSIEKCLCTSQIFFASEGNHRDRKHLICPIPGHFFPTAVRGEKNLWPTCGCFVKPCTHMWACNCCKVKPITAPFPANRCRDCVAAHKWVVTKIPETSSNLPELLAQKGVLKEMRSAWQQTAKKTYVFVESDETSPPTTPKTPGYDPEYDVPVDAVPLTFTVNPVSAPAYMLATLLPPVLEIPASQVDIPTTPVNSPASPSSQLPVPTSFPLKKGREYTHRGQHLDDERLDDEPVFKKKKTVNFTAVINPMTNQFLNKYSTVATRRSRRTTRPKKFD